MDRKPGGRSEQVTQIEKARMQNVAGDVVDSVKACWKNVAEKPEYVPITSRFYFGLDTQFPLNMLMDKDLPTKQEISLLYSLHGDTQECRKVALDGAAKMHPLVLSVLVQTYSDTDKLWVVMTRGKLSWGQFNTERKEIITRGQANLVQADMQISAQLQNQSAISSRWRAA